MESGSERPAFDHVEWSERIAAITAEAYGVDGISCIERSIGGLLRIVREQIDLEVVFVGEFVEGRRIFRHVAARDDDAIIEVGQSHEIDQTICQRIVDGRMPHVIDSVAGVRTQYGLSPAYGVLGAHIGVPVRFADGGLYGVLCGFSLEARDHLGERDLKRMEMAANAAARLLAQARGLDVEPVAQALN